MSQIYLQEKLTGTQGQVVSFDIYNRPIIKTLTPTLDAKIYATIPAGATVSATKGSVTIPGTLDSGNTYIINIPSIGLWTVTATVGANNYSDIVNITGNGIYYITIEQINRILENNSWSDIQYVAQQSLGSSYWSIGDLKSAVLNGSIGNYLTLTNFTVYFGIIGFDHNSTVEGTGITFQLLKLSSNDTNNICLIDSEYDTDNTNYSLYMRKSNQTNTTQRWNSSYMKMIYMSEFINCLPSNLSSVIKEIQKYSNSDVTDYSFALYSETAFLLSIYEYFGTVTYGVNFNEDLYCVQYSYYNNNSRIKYSQNDGITAVRYWTRSTDNEVSYGLVTSNGTFGAGSQSFSYGIAPAFVIG